MRWSQLNNAQKKFLATSAQWRPIIVQGVVVGHKPFNAYAEAIVSAKNADRDHSRRARDEFHRIAPGLMAAYQGGVKVQHIKPGAARGANELQRKRAGALPMGWGVNGKV